MRSGCSDATVLSLFVELAVILRTVCVVEDSVLIHFGCSHKLALASLKEYFGFSRIKTVLTAFDCYRK